ncbi:MAG: nitrous oxide-stimulated promoter family protein [Chloroflexi bacterium]|nr:nitrous oxide-stimulated promoter family protein [Chloroflexota bacterium]
MVNLLQERNTSLVMIRIYCRDHHVSEPLCEACSHLWDYVCARLEKCPFGEEKPTCKSCKVHCYEPKMQEQIREIMRYSGPRMIFSHPAMAIRHLLHMIKKG